MVEKPNPMQASFEGGAPRRRKAGERSGATPEEGKMLTVSIPLSLHRRLKRHAVEGDETMRQIIIRLLDSDLP